MDFNCEHFFFYFSFLKGRRERGYARLKFVLFENYIFNGSFCNFLRIEKFNSSFFFGEGKEMVLMTL